MATARLLGQWVRSRRYELVIAAVLTLAFVSYRLGYHAASDTPQASREKAMQAATEDRIRRGQELRNTPGPRRRITAKEMGDKWPLTVDEVDIECRADGRLALIHYDGVIYGINGTAMQAGFTDFRPLWKDNPTEKGLKINIGPLIAAARRLCGKSTLGEDN